MMGWITAVLVEIAIPPFGSVEVTGTKTATRLVGRADSGAGEGVITMLWDVGAFDFDTRGSRRLAGFRSCGANIAGT